MPQDSRYTNDDWIFLLSPTGRSGTNFVRNLLVHAGVCEVPLGNVFSSEDQMLRFSDHLWTYTTELKVWWQKTSPASEAECDLIEARLLRELGQALLRTVDRRGRMPCLLKTPSTENIDRFFQLFGNLRMLLLVRDGRDVCESLKQSGYMDDYDNAFEFWRKNTQTMLDFLGKIKDHPQSSHVHILRYEDAVKDPAQSVTNVADWLELDVGRHKFSTFGYLPVVGSSELGQSNDGTFEYKTVAKPANFNPLERWKSWPLQRKESFKRIANKQLVDLGYETGENW